MKSDIMLLLILIALPMLGDGENMNPAALVLIATMQIEEAQTATDIGLMEEVLVSGEPILDVVHIHVVITGEVQYLAPERRLIGITIILIAQVVAVALLGL